MTKRFTRDMTFLFSKIKDNGKPLEVNEILDLLNEQDEKIKELEQIILDLTNNQAVTVIKKGNTDEKRK